VSFLNVSNQTVAVFYLKLAYTALTEPTIALKVQLKLVVIPRSAHHSSANTAD
jgi:hypothetical protein